MTKKFRHQNDYLWKGILEDVFDDFLRFMHSKADEIFDFERGITFLDKELAQLFPTEEEDEYAVKIVDKLAKIYTKEGAEQWVLIHCEVQAKYSTDFPLRMFTYFYRIWDKYNKPISAYAILTENNRKIRPNQFIMKLLDTEQIYRYKVYKIAQQSEEELLQSNNPFAMVVLIVRSVFDGKNLDNAKERDAALMEIKLRLSKKFLAMELPKDKIRMIMNFLKNYIHFENSENGIIFDRKLDHITGRTKTMGIEELILTTERKRARKLGEKLGEKRGAKRGIQEGIERNRKEMLSNMIQKSPDDQFIADFAGVPLSMVRKMRAAMKPN
ncbi:MAG: hypothetical protein LBN18_03690 [Dysgonamonadaceae bacterium]|jgi:hypothetical protein|nr:hypothetical protein [Dysgonamonadaceae bacterium]